MAEKAESKATASSAESRIMDFERNRMQLLNMSNQRQQLQVQSGAMAQALEELEKTKEKTVFKAVGNILVQAETEKVKKEIAEKKDSADLRIKTLQKQEESLVNKLNKIKADLEKGTEGKK